MNTAEGLSRNGILQTFLWVNPATKGHERYHSSFLGIEPFWNIRRVEITGGNWMWGIDILIIYMLRGA